MRGNTACHSKSYLPCLADREEYSSSVWNEVCQPKCTQHTLLCIAIRRIRMLIGLAGEAGSGKEGNDL